MLAGHPALDELVELPRRWLKRPGTVLDLRRRIGGRFDVTIDVQGLLKSAVAARLSGAPLRIGLARPAGRELSPWLNNRLVAPTATHVVERNLELLAPLGIRPASVRFDLPERAEDGATARQILAGLFGGRTVAILNPGAAGHRSCGRPIVLPRWPGIWTAGTGWPRWLSGPARPRRVLADEIVASSAGGAQAAPATTLCELAALARRARLFVSSDTGPLHLAAAVAAPCVGLFGPMPAERNGPYGAGHIWLQNVCLSGSSRQRRGANNDSMRAISAGEVTAACDEILARADRRSA